MDPTKEAIAILSRHNRDARVYSLTPFLQLRALMNQCDPRGLPREYFEAEGKAIAEENAHRSFLDVDSLPEIAPRIALVRADISTLRADALVNACNEQLLGCYAPLHGCIDNCLHSYAGLKMRRDLIAVMLAQGHEEPNGRCKVTKGYHLPCRFVFHTVGPKAFHGVGRQEEEDLASCYASCLRMAERLHLSSLAFPCLATGVYGYPLKEATHVAISQAKKHLAEHPDTCLKKIVFCVYTEEQYEAYHREFGQSLS